jgi:hypothetical protein
VKLLSRPWSEAEIARLRELVQKGATVLRCSAALARPAASIRRTARQLGLAMAGIRELNAGNRRRIEDAEKDLRPGSQRNDGSWV